MSANKLYPAVLGGLFIGVFSALPVISIGNLCCCLWLIVGGVIAAWVMQQNHPSPVTPGDGALVGLLAGVIGAFAYLLIAWPVAVLFGPMMDRWLQTVVENAGDTPMREVFERYRGDGGARTLSVFANFVLHFVLGLIFPTLGGILGAVLFRKSDPPGPPAVSYPPPPAPGGPWTPPLPPAIQGPPQPPQPPPPPAVPMAGGASIAGGPGDVGNPGSSTSDVSDSTPPDGGPPPGSPPA